MNENTESTASTIYSSSPHSMEDLETHMKRLEEITALLQQGKLNLSVSLELYEEGVSLYKKCRQHIMAAEKKVKILTDTLNELDF